MTVAASDLADALRWVWLVVGVVWIGYAWLYRVPYRRVFWGLIALGALDWVLHWTADFVERPDSNLPSDFSLYSLGMLAACLAGLGVAFAYGHRRGISINILIAAALVCVAAGALAGRGQYVWSNWDYFVENSDVIGDLTSGGMAWRGALIAGTLALFLFALVTRKPFWQLADAAALGTALALSIGWYTAHLTHLYYGLAIDETLSSGSLLEPLTGTLRAFGFNFVQDLPDSYNVIALRIPVQLMASIFYLLLFFLLLYIALRESSRAHDGSTFIAFLAFTSAAGLLFGFWRGDAAGQWNGLRADQWLDLLLLGCAAALAARRKWFTRAGGSQTTAGVIQHA